MDLIIGIKILFLFKKITILCFLKKILLFVQRKSILLQRDIAPLRDIPLPSLGVSSLDLAAPLGGPFFGASVLSMIRGFAALFRSQSQCGTQKRHRLTQLVHHPHQILLQIRKTRRQCVMMLIHI